MTKAPEPPDWTKVTDLSRLRARIEELEYILGIHPPPVRVCDLTYREMQFINIIASRVSVHKEALFTAIYGDSEVQEKILDVFLCKVRKKIPPHITIETLWGRGYTMSPESRAAWRQLLKDHEDGNQT